MTSSETAEYEHITLILMVFMVVAWMSAQVRASEGNDFEHYVPVDKKLDPQWVKELFAKGTRKVYHGKELETIGMPIGGICAGQVYIAGDGRLMHWDVFNQYIYTGHGGAPYNLNRKPSSPLEQGFAVRVRTDGKTIVRSLDSRGFPDVRFCGEYPVAFVEYEDEDVPVSVELRAFSPFIPLNASDSALPATVMQFTVKNTSKTKAEVTLAGWLQNAVCLHSGRGAFGKRINRVLKRRRMTMLLCRAEPVAPPKRMRPPVVFADFEGKDYGDWKVEGEAFGQSPARGTLANQQPVSGFFGKGLVNSFLNDRPHGRLTSPVFNVERPYISFLIGGGAHKDKTCINLIVDGEVVRTATGQNSERLMWHCWNVENLEGKEAHIEIVDAESAGWGHINLDHIEFGDEPRTSGTAKGKLADQTDFGTMGLVVLGNSIKALSSESLPDGDLPGVLFGDAGLASGGAGEKSFARSLRGAVGQVVNLKPGEETQANFVVTWCFPNRQWNSAYAGPDPKTNIGNYYSKRFDDAAAVARYIADNFDRLAGQTRLWHQTYYDSTLPHWLLDRLFSAVSTLASSTCQWWRNGRFWAWEGVGAGWGTCTHVWAYGHAMARLFPELERSVRKMQDFGVGFDESSGMVSGRASVLRTKPYYAADGQCGTILKAYREHLMSPDDSFLSCYWPSIKKAMEFMLRQDGNDDGLIENAQLTTYDREFFGANTHVGALYLAALRAAEEMAKEIGDQEFAERCRKVFESGRQLTVERLWDGEYFFQQVDLKKHPEDQYGRGCLSDQLFGQGWSHQIGLGYLYPSDLVKKAVRSVWKYNWAPDVGPQNEAHQPLRRFAHPGEAGLFNCTWPKSKRGPGRVPNEDFRTGGPHYRNEVWTGIEYQLAGHMAWEGMVTEALAICRGIHERYDPLKHNPWNEVEFGDHYARGMASWGVLIGLCGFEYHGPNGHIGFAPRINADDFRAVFTAAEGWGSLVQKRREKMQINRIQVKWGELHVKTLAFELPKEAKLSNAEAAISVGGRLVEADVSQQDNRVTVVLTPEMVIETGQALEVTLNW